MKNQTQPLEEASIQQYCKAVRVPVIGANFVTPAEQAAKENHSHVRYLEALLAMECEERDRHAIENRTRDAQLPRVKTLEEFDFAQAPQIPAARIRELAEGGYIARSEPVALIGECGTGKSHLATGLCLAACRQKRRVRFITAAALVNELVEAKQNGKVKRIMARWIEYDLIALDEVGYVPLADKVVNIKKVIHGRAMAEDLQKTVASRQELAGLDPAHAPTYTPRTKCPSCRNSLRHSRSWRHSRTSSPKLSTSTCQARRRRHSPREVAPDPADAGVPNGDLHLYIHQGREGKVTVLEDIVTGAACRAIVPSGYRLGEHLKTGHQ